MVFTEGTDIPLLPPSRGLILTCTEAMNDGLLLPPSRGLIYSHVPFKRIEQTIAPIAGIDMPCSSSAAVFETIAPPIAGIDIPFRRFA